MKTRYLVIKQQLCPECDGKGEVGSFIKHNYFLAQCPACKGAKINTELVDLEQALASLNAMPTQDDHK